MADKDEYIRDSDGNIVYSSYGLPIKKYSLEGIKYREAEHKRQFNTMIGEYVEKGYTYVSSDEGLGLATFYHHANNELQDDIVLVNLRMHDGKMTDTRMIVERQKFLNIAKEMEDIESKRK